jgi:hypothetical protein
VILQRPARLASLLLAATLLAASAEAAAPVSHPGWPVTITTPGAIYVKGTAVQMAGMYGDGSRQVLVTWTSCVDSYCDQFPGTIEIRDQGGSLEKRIDFNRLHETLALVDRDDDGVLEIVTPRGQGLSMFDVNGTMLWDHSYIPNDPTWGRFVGISVSVGDLDGDGRQWVVASSDGSGHPAIYAFDMEGNLRSGWPVWSDSTVAFYSPPALVDLDGDGELEILAPYSYGEIKCVKPDGTTCPGWPFFSDFDGTFDYSQPIGFVGADGERYVAAVQRRGVVNKFGSVHVIDRFGHEVVPFPVQLGAYQHGNS